MMLSSAPLRPISAAEKAAYTTDGAVILRGVLPFDWIERMRVAVDRILAAPGAASVEYTPQGKSGRYLGDFFVWMRDPDFRAFMAESPLPALAAQMMGASYVNFFYDQLLVKEPQTAEETPWHQDLPYWPLRGADILSFWVSFDAITQQAGTMAYVKGSHRAGTMYAPKAFGSNTGYAQLFAKMGLPPLPDMAEYLKGREVLTWDVEPGDVIVHHPLTLHYSPGNATKTVRRRALALRYLGDDAVYDARPGTFVENPKIQAILPEPIAYRDGDRLGGANFPAVWPR